MTEILTREYGLANNTAPTGKILGIIPLEHNPSLFEIRYVDGKVGGGLPESLGGLWTGRRIAQEAITDYLIKVWTYSDAEAESRRAKRAS